MPCTLLCTATGSRHFGWNALGSDLQSQHLAHVHQPRSPALKSTHSRGTPDMSQTAPHAIAHAFTSRFVDFYGLKRRSRSEVSAFMV